MSAAENEKIRPIGMPKWGLAMTEGKIGSWLVAEGSAVREGDEIAEIETSKITNVFESPAAGTLRRHVAAEGETLPVGAVIAVLADADVADGEIDAFVADARAKQAEAAHAPPPPEPALTPAQGWTVRALRMGEGEATPLLLIHGFGGDLLSWQFNQDFWAQQRPVIAIDLPGHGGSSKQVPHGDVASLARMVAAAMDALEISRAHFAGHSLGGAIALQLALDEPARVASVTLVCSAGLGPEVDMEYINGFVAADRRKEMKPVIEKLFADPGLVTRDMLEDLVRYKRLDGVDAALRTIADATFAGGRQATVLRDRLGAVRVPVQAIWGEQDRIIPAAHAAAVERRHVVPGAGHMVHIERPEQVNRAVQEFLAASG